MRSNNVVITGVGLISAAGLGIEAHKIDFAEHGALGLDNESFAPFYIHQIPKIDWSRQIIRKSDQRQMGLWQKLGVFAAGMALDDANVKHRADLLQDMAMIVAAGGGERDVLADCAILEKCRKAKTPDERSAILNRGLLTQLRPTLFLTQLTNLLAGNISIIHKVTGASSSYMGEEGAGITAFEMAKAAIEAGQSKQILVGGAYNAASYDMLLNLQLGTKLAEDRWMPVQHRLAQGGSLVPGSGAVFLLLEEAEHASAREAKIYAKIQDCITQSVNRNVVDFADNLASLYSAIGITNGAPVISGISGELHSTKTELCVLEKLGAEVMLPVNNVGYMKEIQLLFAVALAAIRLWQKEYERIYATTIGIKRSEAAVCLTIG